MPEPSPGPDGGPAAGVVSPASGLAAVLPVRLGAHVRAGFSTVALGNLGLGALAPDVTDDPAAVHARRARVAAWAGGPVAWTHQVHGVDVRLVGPGDQVPASGAPLASCDALVSAGEVGVAVVVADCVPVLLADPVAGLVAAVHAGRRGLAAGVVPAALRALAAAGATDVRAVVGPAVCGECYEVPAELRDEVEAAVPGTASTTSWGTPALDLPGGVLAQLRAAGVRAGATGWCTRTDDRFFSHRRASAGAGPHGRVCGVVRLAG